MAVVRRSPADSVSTPIDGVEVIGSLSPSRAIDFTTCPLLYRFRTIDKLPEPVSLDAVRGTLVHKVLELLFDLPAEHRSPDQAVKLLPDAWAASVADEPELADLTNNDDFETWWTSCETTLVRYFELEDPSRLEPAEREFYLESLLDSRLLLRGFIDRIDIAPDGRVRVVDYKTGRSPGERTEARALFQMKFYALMLARRHGVIPARLQLVYLGNSEILQWEPDPVELRATQRKIEAIWTAIQRAEATGDWQPSPSKMCGWCPHQALCPAFGGTPPQLPVN